MLYTILYQTKGTPPISIKNTFPENIHL